MRISFTKLAAIGAILLLMVTYFGVRSHGPKHSENDALISTPKNHISKNSETSRKNLNQDLSDSFPKLDRSKIESDLGNLDEVISLAKLIEDGEERCQTFKMIVDVWARKDPDASFCWAMSLDEKVGKDYIIAQTILTLVNYKNTQKAESLLSLLPSGKTKDVSIEYCINEAASFDVGLAVRLSSLLASPDSIKFTASSLAKNMIGKRDFISLQQITDDIPYGMMKENLNSAVMRELSFIDPFLALDWMRKNQSDRNSVDLMNLARGFSETNVLEGIKIAEEFDGKSGKSEFLRFMVGNWASKDQAAAINWAVNKIQNGSFYSNKSVFESIAQVSIITNQDLIFEQIGQIENMSERSAATLSAAKILSEYNPEKAAQIALATPGDQSKAKVETLTVTAKNWLNRDPLTASKWIGSLTAGPVKDSAVSELVRNILIKDKDIVMANSWASQISDPEIRAKVNTDINRIKP